MPSRGAPREGFHGDMASPRRSCRQHTKRCYRRLLLWGTIGLVQPGKIWMLSVLTLGWGVVLAALTFGRRLLADVLGEVAFVAVRAVPAFDAGQSLTDAPILVAVIGRRARVQPASDFGPGRTRRPGLRLFGARGRGGRALRARRLAATRGDDEAKTNHAQNEPKSPHAGKMIGFEHGGKAYSRMR